MKFLRLASMVTIPFSLIHATNTAPYSNNPPPAPPLPSLPVSGIGSGDPLQVYTLEYNDSNTAHYIRAQFIPYGARLISLLVSDRNGVLQDVVVGYDNPAQYIHDTETNHTYFGAVVGRYANRIANGTFNLNNQTYHIPENEGGHDTLHGGTVGYDQRNWTVMSYCGNSVSFGLLDTAFEGFPGDVFTNATFTVSLATSGPGGQLRPRLTSTMFSYALDSLETPIMLANHIYWSLNAMKEPTILNDTTLGMPYSDRYIEIDGIEVPTGVIGSVLDQQALDFLSPRLFGPAIANAQGLCGTNCTGIDNAFIVDRPGGVSYTSSNFPILTMSSNTTGIQLDLSTNQIGLQIYTCNGQNGTIPVKQSQQARNVGDRDATGYVQKYGCAVIETQAWIDAINQPEWGIDKYEIFSNSTGPAVVYGTYDFSTFQ